MEYKTGKTFQDALIISKTVSNGNFEENDSHRMKRAEDIPHRD